MTIDNFTGEYAFLSNFYGSAPVHIFGHTFRNSEAAFQAWKCPERVSEFCNLDPSAAKRLGRSVPVRDDWEDIKYRVMWAVCFAKFLQNEDVRNKLILTENAHLIEGNTWGDTTWGVCRGKGDNWLGEILESVRDTLRDHVFQKRDTYIVGSIYNKRKIYNKVHDTALLRPAYVLEAIPGMSAEIRVLPYDDEEYHRLWTSVVRSVTPYGDGEDVIILETRNSRYTLYRVL